MSSAALDLDKFRKVWRLATDGATEGEKSAARARAEAIAARAGLSVDEALSKAFHQPSSAPDWKSAFDDIVAEKRRQEALRRQKIRDEIVRRYAGKFAIFELTPNEVALRKSVQSFARHTQGRSPFGQHWLWTTSIDRASFFGGLSGLNRVSKRARQAIERALPAPETLAAALDELRAWERLRRDREAFVDHGEWPELLEVQIRRMLIEEILDSRPVQTWDDAQARFDWYLFRFQHSYLDPEKYGRADRDNPDLNQAEKDLAALRAVYERRSAPPENPVPRPRSPRRPDPRQADLFMKENQP